jgi:hypothetical protein
MYLLVLAVLAKDPAVHENVVEHRVEKVVFPHVGHFPLGHSLKLHDSFRNTTYREEGKKDRRILKSKEGRTEMWKEGEGKEEGNRGKQNGGKEGRKQIWKGGREERNTLKDAGLDEVTHCAEKESKPQLTVHAAESVHCISHAVPRFHEEILDRSVHLFQGHIGGERGRGLRHPVTIKTRREGRPRWETS